MEQKVFLVFNIDMSTFVNLKCRFQKPECKGAVLSSYLLVSMVTQELLTLMPVAQLIHVESNLNC